MLEFVGTIPQKIMLLGEAYRSIDNMCCLARAGRTLLWHCPHERLLAIYQDPTN